MGPQQLVLAGQSLVPELGYPSIEGFGALSVGSVLRDEHHRSW